MPHSWNRHPRRRCPGAAEATPGRRPWSAGGPAQPERAGALHPRGTRGTFHAVGWRPWSDPARCLTRYPVSTRPSRSPPSPAVRVRQVPTRLPKSAIAGPNRPNHAPHASSSPDCELRSGRPRNASRKLLMVMLLLVGGPGADRPAHPPRRPGCAHSTPARHRCRTFPRDRSSRSFRARRSAHTATSSSATRSSSR